MTVSTDVVRFAYLSIHMFSFTLQRKGNFTYISEFVAERSLYVCLLFIASFRPIWIVWSVLRLRGKTLRSFDARLIFLIINKFDCVTYLSLTRTIHNIC